MANGTEKSQGKWTGQLKETVRAPFDKAWEVASNFLRVGDWVKTMDHVELVEGEPQKPGCVRYMIGNTFPRADGTKSWAKEKLLSIDDETHVFSYSMLDNNFGYKGYVGTFKMADPGDGTSSVDWSFEVEPLENKTEEQLRAYMIGVFRKALKLLEDRVNAL